MNILEFLKELKKYKSVKDVIEKFNIKYDNIENGKSKQGYIYERLWDICIKFGLVKNIIPFNTNNKLKHINGNINKEIKTLNITNFEETKDFFNTYLNENIISGNSGGYSDITFANDKNLVISSAKYFEKTKSINDYDIEKLCILFDTYKENKIHNTLEIKVVLFIKDKKEFIQEVVNKVNKSSLIILKYINPNGNYENVFDLKDLEVHFEELKKLLAIYNYFETQKDINDFKKEYLKSFKKIFKPRFHQQLFIKQSIDIINKKSSGSNSSKKILIGAVPRSGKTFIMAGIILDYIKVNKIAKGCNFIIITPVPSETIEQYEEVFNNYLEFEKYNIKTHIITKLTKNITEYKETNNVFLISIQKLNRNTDTSLKEKKLLSKNKSTEYKNEKKADLITRIKKINPNYPSLTTLKKAGLIAILKQTSAEIKDKIKKHRKGGAVNNDKIKEFTKFINALKFDIIFIDEAHFAMTTINSKELINFIDEKDTWKIYVTATYNKPIKRFVIPNNKKLFWNIRNTIELKRNANMKDDKKKINKFKEIYEKDLKKRFKEKIINEVLLEDYNIDKLDDINKINVILNQYKHFPEPFLITTIWNKVETIYKELNKAEDTNYSFDMNRLFALKKDKTDFENKEQLSELFYYYFGYPRKEISYNHQTFYKNYGIIPRIQRICNNNCRTLQKKHKTTQLWFLPFGTDQVLFDVIQSLISLLKTHFNYIFKRTIFLVAISDSKNGIEADNIKYNSDNKIKEVIKNLEETLNKEANYDNLIILTGARLQLGISLPNVDIVVLFNSIKSGDALYQSMFRSMTEIDNNDDCIINDFCPKKKYGFVVDLNPQRTLTITDYIVDDILYDDKDKIDETLENKRKLITDLFNIDKDIFKINFDDNADEKDNNTELLNFSNELFRKLSIDYSEKVNNIIDELDKINFDFDYNKIENFAKIINKYNHNTKNNKQEFKNENHIDELDEKPLVHNSGSKKTNKKNETDEQKLKGKIKSLLGELIIIISIITSNTKIDIITCIFDEKNKKENKFINNIKIKLKELLEQIKTNELKDIFIHIVKNRCNIDEEDDIIFTLFEEIIKSINDRNE